MAKHTAPTKTIKTAKATASVPSALRQEGGPLHAQLMGVSIKRECLCYDIANVAALVSSNDRLNLFTVIALCISAADTERSNELSNKE